MKKETLFKLSAALIAVASSCAKEDIPAVVDEVKMVPASILAESNNTETKTVATYVEPTEEQPGIYHITWEKGDELSVFYSYTQDEKVYQTMTKFTAASSGAETTFNGEILEGSTIEYAILPYDKDATVSDKTIKTHIPAVQNGDFSNIVLAGWPKPAPTKADVEEYNIRYRFEAVSGILKFSFDPKEIAKYEDEIQHIVQISITADRPIAGGAKISYADGKPVMTADPNGTASNQYNTITLVASDPQNGFSKGDYYIATLPIKKSEFPDGMPISVKCETKEGETAYINATIGGEGKTHILTANVVKNIGTVKTKNYVPHFTSGEFTVDGNGTKVSFSPGNLQYQASSNTWRFALNQWDAQGEVGNMTQPEADNVNARSKQSEWIDLFPWGHSGFEYDNTKYLPYQAIPRDDLGLYLRSQTNALTGNYADGDWGKFCSILNGNKTDAPGTWRLLSFTEFSYIAYTRTCNKKVVDNPYSEGAPDLTINFNFLRCGINTGCKDKGDKDIVRYGVMLFPDGFTWPDGYPIPNAYWSGCDIDNKSVKNENAYVYSLSDFAIFESKGVVFLPSAGQWRFETGMNKITMANAGDGLNTFNIRGDYWTTNKSQTMTCYTGHILEEDSLGNNTNIGRSVRLVKAVPAATAEHEGVENDGDYNF